RAGEVGRVAKMGAASYIDEQLAASLEEDDVLKLRLHSIEVFGTDAIEMRDLQEREVLRQLQKAAFLRAVYSRNQLQERMIDFWSNHFNIYARKGLGAYFTPRDQENVIRRHALQSFPDLLRASAHSPAMLSYLDNQVNRRGVATENYARELMELHTLGVRGGYTQKDVQEVARCFTGWTVEDRFLRRRGTFRFDAQAHDNGPKTVLGVRIPAGGGQSDGDRVLDILAAHPSTAHFIAGKLCRFFLGSAEALWTQRLARIYRQTHGDIKAMLRPLLLSDELLASPPTIKRPFDFMVSALRALNADTDGDAALQKHLTAMGQGLYLWPMPDGYPDRTASWTGSLLARWNFALALAFSDIKGTSVNLSALVKDQDASKALSEIVWSRRFDEATAQRISGVIPVLDVAIDETNEAAKSAHLAQTTALLLCAPEFQWR
ncbi:MAG TPA: DUF1800 domain-containing protein, partial [Abditibacteriaceae bacterium]|nr:DUF1800 domain-containing protein [Abditibacteriaceae bacterium]